MDPHTGQALELSYPTGYGRKYRWLLEAIFVVASDAAYEWVRSTLGRKGAADRNGARIIHWEMNLHIFWEKHFQQFAIDHKRFTQFLNLYYGTVHFIVPVVVLASLWHWRPSLYSLWRNRIFALTLMALIGFWLVPLTPPRLMPHDLLPPHVTFYDTDAMFGGQGILNQGAAKDTNLYAAMPSLHVGWALWCAAAAGPLLRRRWLKIAVYAYPIFTFATVTATGNHYWLDGFAGIAIDLIGYWVGLWITRAINRRRVRARQHHNSVGDNESGNNSQGHNQTAGINSFVEQPQAN